MTNIHNVLADCYNHQSNGKMHCALPSKSELSAAMALNAENQAKLERITLAGKHLAVKLAETYKAAGLNPADCQAIKDFMGAL